MCIVYLLVDNFLISELAIERNEIILEKGLTQTYFPVIFDNNKRLLIELVQYLLLLEVGAFGCVYLNYSQFKWKVNLLRNVNY